MVIVRNARPMKNAMRRTRGVRWDCWRRMVTMRSLELMVMNGVIRHATVDPPQYLDACADIEASPEDSLSLPPVIIDEQGWFTRFFRRREFSPLTHERHTT